MRWVYVIISASGIVLALLAHTPFWFGLGVAMAALFVLAATLAFAHDRIAGSARAEDLDEFELQQLRDAVRGTGARTGEQSLKEPR